MPGAPSARHPLSPGECEIWVASSSDFTGHQAALDEVLTADERVHVQQIREGQAMARLSRGLLRLVLARYLDLPPALVDIDRSCPNCARWHGRPRLRRRPDTATGGIEFSVAHGGDLLVLAFAGNPPIGVDIEPIGSLEGVDPDLVDFALTAAERRQLLAVPTPQRWRTFLRQWTAKEAALKALGTGLDTEPQAVTLSAFPIEPKASVTLPGSPPVELWITDLEVGPAHVCTLATGQELREVTSARLSPDLTFSDRSLGSGT